MQGINRRTYITFQNVVQPNIWFILAVLICVFWVAIRIIHITALIYGSYKLHKRKKIMPNCPEKSTPGKFYTTTKYIF